MFVFNFLIILLLLLIVVVIFSTVIKLSLFFTNRYNYDSSILILPSLLSFINSALIFILWYSTITRLLKMDLFTFIINFFIKNVEFSGNLLSIYLISAGFIVLFILLQAFVYLTVNIDYNKATGKTRIFFKKVLHVNLDENINESLPALSNKQKKLTFINSLVASIFSFALVFFVLILLYSIGNIISNKIV